MKQEMHERVYEKLLSSFLEIFGEPKEGIRFFFAPGRVNLIGEHTDYNGGVVLPATLSKGTWVLGRPRQDGAYRFFSLQFSNLVITRGEEILYNKEDGWGNYPKGVLRELSRIPSLKGKLTGADLLFDGNIPHGAGLSSSASIEVVTAYALSKLAGVEIPLMEIALLSQRAENRFVGVQCGIMDQAAISLGRRDSALLLRTATLAYEYIPLSLEGYKWVITNTNKRRTLADSKYNERREECEEGLRQLQRLGLTIDSLGELTEETWKEVRDQVEGERVRKRIDHVVGEDERVFRSVVHLKERDLPAFGALLNESHASLRDLYEVTGVELDALQEEAVQVEGCLGSRMTGAGFGGCTVSLVREEA
ncbi:MAG: galactokinase, partial [Thermicanus sp.]|nr:galactokinase [Thermicanus sp.]